MNPEMDAPKPPSPASKLIVFARRTASTLFLWVTVSVIFASRWSWAYLGLIGLLVLIGTIEYFRIPRNVLTICLGKSTYARCGIIVNVTPFEPEWEGYVTLEFSNTTPLPAKIYAGEGCAQVLFFESDEVCETSYKDRGGKYQGQTGVTLPRT